MECGRRDFASEGCFFKNADLSLTVTGFFALQGCCVSGAKIYCKNWGVLVPVGILQCKVLAETNMTMQNPEFEVFPFEHGDFPLSCLYFVGVGFFVADRGLPLQGICFNSENFYQVL